MAAKIFDYKFLIILGLSLVVYFLYREVELLNKRVALLESSSKPIQENTKPKLFIDLPPPPPSRPQTPVSQEKKEDEPLNENKQIQMSVEENEYVNNHTVEEYSNEHKDNSVSDIQQLYSHDKLDSNTNEQDTLMIDSIINMTKESPQPVELNIDSLMKKKLDELQEMATQSGINISNENGKKKKKVDLANELLNNKQQKSIN